VRTKVTLVLVLLNVALFFFIFKFERAWRTENEMQEARRRVLGSETANIRSLSVTSSIAGGPAFTVVRNREFWTLTQPLDWPANQEAVSSIVRTLQFLENETSFGVADLAKNGQSLADFGLDAPKVTVSFTYDDSGAPTAQKAGGATVLRIGDTTKDGNRTYVLSPDGSRIHVVGRQLINALTLPLDQLRADTILTIPVVEAKALTVQTGARVRIARRDGGRWTFDTIVNARAGKTAMEITIKDLGSLSAASFPATPPPSLPSTSPTLRVTIDGNGRSETLFLGEPVKAESTAPAQGSPATPSQAAASTTYYGQLMNGNSVRAPVFTVAVPNGLLERLRNAQNDLRERRILDFDPASVTSITLAAPNQGLPAITLQRLDSNAPDSPWQLVRPVNGASDTQTVPAESAAVRRLLDRLALLSAVRFEADAPSNAQMESWGFNRPEREISLALAGAPGGANRPVVLQLGTGADGTVYARTGAQNDLGPSVYSVASDLTQDFPVDPNAWRNRTLRELPAAARISSVKLTDLSSKQVIVDTTLGATGKPAAQVRDAAALGELVSCLRVIRAKRYVQDRFADRILAGGDERTWRYQVDATIALPGSAGEQTSTLTLFTTERIGGTQQLAGSRDLDAVFELEQPFVDALWKLTYGPRDPGPQLEKK
jgi:hypothetical protein